jgi:uncharacterized protein
MLPAWGEPSSFNCAKAAHPDERAICADAELSRLDNIVNSGFQFLRRTLGHDRTNALALPLLRERQACGSEISCIKAPTRDDADIPIIWSADR